MSEPLTDAERESLIPVLWTETGRARMLAQVERIIAAREAQARREVVYELGVWCGECDPADPDDECCVLPERVRSLLTVEAVSDE